MGDYIFVSDQGTTDNGNMRDLVVNSMGEAHLTLANDPITGSDKGFTVRKCNNAGTMTWEHIYLNTEQNTYARAIECDESGNTYFSGKFIEDSLDLDPGINEDYMQNAGYSMGFVVKINQSGDYSWSYHLDHSALYPSSQVETNFNNLKMIEPNSLFVTNYSQGATLFKLAVNGNLDISNPEAIASSTFIYPNPNDGEFSIKIPNGTIAKIKILNTSGKLIQEMELTKSITTLQLNFESGVYFIRINDDIHRIVIR